MGMELSEICSAESAKKRNFADNFCRIFLGGKGPIVILHVMRCHCDIVSFFDKVRVVTTFLTDDTANRLTGRDLNFFH